VGIYFPLNHKHSHTIFFIQTEIPIGTNAFLTHIHSLLGHQLVAILLDREYSRPLPSQMTITCPFYKIQFKSQSGLSSHLLLHVPCHRLLVGEVPPIPRHVHRDITSTEDGQPPSSRRSNRLLPQEPEFNHFGNDLSAINSLPIPVALVMLHTTSHSCMGLAPSIPWAGFNATIGRWYNNIQCATARLSLGSQ
jgi:hypothetical protein